MIGAQERPIATLTPASRLAREMGPFFLLSYLYLRLVIDPRLIRHSLGILAPYHPFSFSAGRPFFREHLLRWGGLVEYGDRLLSELHGFGWAGSLIATTAALLACLCTDCLARLAGGSRAVALRYVPGVVLLAMYGQYLHPLRFVLSLLAALSGFLLYLRLAPRKAAARFAVFLATWAALAYVAGVGSLLFPIMVAVFELLVDRRFVLGALASVLTLGAAWVTGEMLFDFQLDETYGPLLSSDPGIPLEGRPYAAFLFLFFPAVLALAAFQQAAPTRRAMARVNRCVRKTAPPRIRRAIADLRRGKRRWIPALAILLATGVVAWLSLDTSIRTILLTDYYAQREMWPEVLDAASGLPSGTYHAGCNRNVMSALFHTGRLAEEMFRYPQTPGLEFFGISEKLKVPHSYLQESRVLLALGQVNRAERFACEALEGAGDLPAVLELLAVINVVKDRPETATLFLNALAKSPFHRRAAAAMLRGLQSDPRPEDDPQVRAIRRVMVGEDSVSPDLGGEAFLRGVLDENPRNKMAFEFLMAHYLSIGRPDQVVASLDRLKDFGYSTIPRHYQEAIIVHFSASEGRLPAKEFALDPEIVESALRFNEILAGAADRDSGARAAVAAGFGDSYFFYFTYGVSGL